MTESAPPAGHAAQQPGGRKTMLIVLLGLVGVVVVAGVVLFLTVFSSSNDALDPAHNEATGLADGRYAINPDSFERADQACSFSGKPFSFGSAPPASARVTLVGKGSEECGMFEENATTVIFTVTNGLARIVDVER
jgi:hypothetical protein